MQCEIVSPKVGTLTLSGETSDIEPEIEGSEVLAANRALIHNAWAYAKFTWLKVNLPTRDEQEAADKRAETHRDVAVWIADLVDDPGDTTVDRWCSGCFTKSKHLKVDLSIGQLPAYLCENCGSPTLSCAAPQCNNMAVRRRGVVRMPRYCAEHRHEISGFEKASQKMDHLEDYAEFLEYEKPNLVRSTKLVGASLVALATGGAAAFAAAPAIGGAVGSLVGGYSGAAASSYGLALLGFGSLSAGGFGMAGGTIVVAGLGGALGGALGAGVTNAYVRQDKSFHIELLRGGVGVPVVVCNGFLSETGKGWGDWKRMVVERYPDSPVYRVHWGAKELKDLGILSGRSALAAVGPEAVKQAAMTATKAGAKKLGPLAPVLLASELAKNPWHVAKNRADKTGVVLADLLARTKEEAFILIGHSLGARVMVVAAQALGTKKDGPRVHAAHLTGAAVGAKSDWSSLTKRVDHAVYNYYSANDTVLKYLYKTAQAGQDAAGRVGFSTDEPKVKNVDVSDIVGGHSEYYDKVTLL